MSVALRLVMPSRPRPRAFTSLFPDQRGNVAIGYLFVAAMSIAVAIACGGLAVRLFQADVRGQAVLRSNTP